MQGANLNTLVCRGLLIASAVVCSARPGAGELQPEEVGIIAVRRSARSQELAEYYAEARGIPEGRICLIDVEPAANLSRRDWQLRVRPAIRRWIAENELQHKLRCLVTTWDVPLKIGRVDSKEGPLAERRLYLEGERRARIARLQRLAEQLDDVLPAEQPADDEERDEELTEDSSLEEIEKRLQGAFEAARERLMLRRDAPEAPAANEQILQLFRRDAGLAAQVATFSKRSPDDPQARAKLEAELQQARGRLQGLREGAAALARLPESVSRDQQILAVIEKSDGVLGTLRWIDAQLGLLKKNETYASFDSELSLLYWPAYPLLRWEPNVLNHRYDDSHQRWLQTTLMVSRLEAPTFELTRKLIDTAVEVEKTGLQGKVYLDARGIGGEKPAARGSYAEYDKALRRLAEVLRDPLVTDGLDAADVTLDNKPALFQPGDCPEAALYCGWYSLAKYVDAFQWQRGAVAYHIASGEAATLRKPNSQVWCKRMLEEGVCATLGPVHEPYLAAFPRPDRFFPLLMTGRYTLVETYYRTKPFNSWVMTLVGDPLYNPFGNNPLVDPDRLPDDLRPLARSDEARAGLRPAAKRQTEN